jgi:hypothetical protein
LQSIHLHKYKSRKICKASKSKHTTQLSKILHSKNVTAWYTEAIHGTKVFCEVHVIFRQFMALRHSVRYTSYSNKTLDGSINITSTNSNHVIYKLLLVITDNAQQQPTLTIIPSIKYCMAIALRPQTPKHIRGGWSHYTDTNEPVDGGVL